MFTPCSFGKVGVEAYAAYALRAWLGAAALVRCPQPHSRSIS